MTSTVDNIGSCYSTLQSRIWYSLEAAVSAIALKLLLMAYSFPPYQYIKHGDCALLGIETDLVLANPQLIVGPRQKSASALGWVTPRPPDHLKHHHLNNAFLPTNFNHVMTKASKLYCARQRACVKIVQAMHDGKFKDISQSVCRIRLHKLNQCVLK